VKNKYFSFRQAYFSDMKEIFRRIQFRGEGQLPLPHATTPIVEGYVTLLPETPGTRVPVQIPDGYPGTKIPESPSTT